MANLGFARKSGSRPFANSGGGVAAPPPRPKPPNANGGLTFDPHAKVPRAAPAGMAGGAIPGTYDPSLDAQKRAAERGEHDTLGDIKTERHFGEKDLNQALRDIHTSVSRKRQKLGIDFGRGNERIGNEETDTKQKAARTEEDFTTKLADIARQFGELGHRQGEGANAAGVNDAGTAAASAAARARQQQLSEAPIHTAQGRLHEDLYTALSRLGTSRGQLEQDRGIGGSQLKQDRERERMLAKRDFGRTNFGLTRKEQRTKREGAIAPVDILEKEIWEGRQNHPGAYAAAGKAQKKGKR